MKLKLLNSLSDANILSQNSHSNIRRIKHQKFFSTIPHQDQMFNLNNSTMNTQSGLVINKSNDRNCNRSKKHIEPLDNYRDKVREVLAQYHGIDKNKLYGTSESSQLIETDSFQLMAEKKQMIKRIQFKAKLFNSNLTNKTTKNNNSTSESSIQVKFPGLIIYNNPYESLKAIRQNHKVFSDINTTFLTRQQDRMEETIENIENEVSKFKNKNSQVRISSMIPKCNSDDESSNQDHYLLGKSHSTEELKLFSFFKYPNKNFPEGKEQFAILVNQNSNVIMIGGMGSNIQHNIIWSLDLESLEWKKIKSKNTPPPCRFGHTASCYNGQVFIYGGRVKLSELSTELVENDAFDLNTLTWSTIKYQNYPVPQKRRNHIAEIVGLQLLIHGGFGYNNKISNDTIVYTFDSMKFTYANLQYNAFSPYLYGHTSCFVVPFDIRLNSRFNLYKYPEYKKKLRMKEMGVYVFGGIAKDNVLSNQIYILSIGKPVLEWKSVETNGKKPLPRYFHSMNFYEKGNFLIIHGGRNDHMGQSSSFALNDTFLLNLSNYDWMEIKLYSKTSDFQPVSRCGHSGFIYVNKLIIFGGMNSNNYIGSSLFVINLNFKYVLNERGSNMENQRRFLLQHYDLCMKDKLKMERFKELTTKNQLAVISDFSLPFIK